MEIMEGNRKGTFVFHVCVKCHIILNSFIQLTLLGTFLSLFWEAREKLKLTLRSDTLEAVKT